MLWDGGISRPTIADVTVILTAKSGSYPFSFISGIMVEPMADALAMAEPDTAPNRADAPTVTEPSPPRDCPKADSAILTRRSAIPDRYIRSPANMKNGIAMRVNTLTPDAMRWNTTTSGISSARKVRIDAAISENATGTPSASRTISETARMVSSISDPPRHQ